MRPRTALAFATIALIALAVGVAYYHLSAPGAPQLAATHGQPFARAAAPKAIPELQFEDGEGRAHTLADFKGRLVLLNLWATWCAPCREEMPALDRLQATLGGPRFQVLALSVDQQGPQIARNFFADVGVKSLGAVGLPSTLLIDPSGREIARHVGPAQWDSPEVVASVRRRIEGAEH